jgi:photosystem II stability/assembly factor-like uncharacterized protein
MKMIPRVSPQAGYSARRNFQRFVAGAALSAVAIWLLAFPAAGRSQANPANGMENGLGGLKARSIGPAIMGGRIDAIAVQEGRPAVFYIGTATGGVWKTVNGGTTFNPVFDQEPNLSIGDVVISSSNPAIVWVGTGEANNRQSSSWGDGIYKSTDGGGTWIRMGLEDTQAIGRIVIDPRNPQTVYVAAAGHLWGPNAERGLFKTTDGGHTWSKVLFIDNDTGVIDVAMDPRSPNILYASTYERRRTAWGFDGGGPGSALYKTTDGGATWKKLTNGFAATGNLGRIGISIYKNNPDIVYAVVEGKDGGVFRSEDQGETWKRTSTNHLGSAYFSQIIVDPNNDLRVWVLLDDLFGSEDGGATFKPKASEEEVHSDFHALWIDPKNSAHMMAGTDGGLWTSGDGGRTWNFINNMPIGQAYQVGYDLQAPYRICAGFQDNGALCGPSRNRSANGMTNRDWTQVHTGDGFYTLIDRSDSNLIYTDAQEGGLVRYDLSTHEWAPIKPRPPVGEPPYRFTWDAPLVLSTHNPKTMYFGGNYLFKSTDRGDTWIRLGGDLTTNIDHYKLPILGKLPTQETVSLNYGVNFYPSITTIAESPVDANVLWVGTEDGNLQISKNEGKSWDNVAENVSGVPKGTWVSSIEASHFAAGTAYAAFDGHRNNDFAIYVFRTADYGKTWQPISSGLTKEDGTANVIREDPYNANLLFLGTEFGAFFSVDQGGHWDRLGAGLPDVRVNDLQIQPKAHDLLIGTHGRSLWVLDNIRPLEQHSSARSADVELFDLRPATEWQKYVGGSGFHGEGVFFAANPPDAIIDYFLTNPAEKSKPVKITIRNNKGEVVRELTEPANAGINRISWDLRYSTPAKPADLQIWAIEQGFFVYRTLPKLGMPAPFIAPGEYTVELSSGGQTSSKTLKVELDPAITIDPADQAAYQTLLMGSFHLYQRGIADQKTLSGLTKSLNDAINSWKKSSNPKVPASVQKSAEALKSKLHDVQAKMIGARSKEFPPPPQPLPIVRQIADLLYSLEAHNARPTAFQQQWFTDLDQSLSQMTALLSQLKDHDLPELNRKINEAGVPFIVVPEPNDGTQPPGHK